MKSEWRLTTPKLRANCVFNFNVPPKPILPGEPVALSLFLGDPVVILAENNGGWYYGHTLANEAHKGVFPQSFVHLSSNAPGKEPLVEEINSSLKEWNAIMKNKYLEDNTPDTNIIKGIMFNVRGLRSALATGKLTEEEAKEHRSKVIAKLDFLNQRLGLDLVVRDSSGNVLQPNKYVSHSISIYGQMIGC